ncbi:MAG: FHA domain-containing protein [Myxococcales bacterium]|nr:FHA domain-containing protein [Myxococcales bacterium]
MQKLVIEDEDGTQTLVPLVREEITIGREEGNTIRLTERNVSRRHARLHKDNGSLYFENIAARYGSKRNGAAVNGRVPFKTGDVFVLGDFRLYLHSEDAAVQTQPGTPSQPQQQHLQEPTEKTALIPIQQVAPSQAAGPAHARLVVLGTNLAGSEFNITKPEVVIGRTPDNDIVINHRSVSQHHAKITNQDGQFRVADLGSANGTRVNGDSYNTVELRRGDTLEFGHVKVRFVAPGEVYTFTPGAVAEDEVPSSGMPTAILVVAVLVVLAAIAVAVVALTGNSDDGEEPVVENNNPDTETEPEVTPENDAVAVVPPGDSDYGATVRDAQRRMNEGSFDDAIELLSSVPVDDAAYSQADSLMIEARRQRNVRDSIWIPMIEAEQMGQFAQALQNLSELPEDSYYHRVALEENIRQRLLDAWLQSSLQASNAALSTNDFAGARTALNDFNAASPEHADVTTQLAAIDTAESEFQRAEQERRDREEQARLERERREREEREARNQENNNNNNNNNNDNNGNQEASNGNSGNNDSGEMSREERRARAEELIGEAQRLGIQQRNQEAIDLLQEARGLNRRDSRIYLMLYSNYARLGRDGDAADALEQYLELIGPDDERYERYRQMLDDLRN